MDSTFRELGGRSSANAPDLLDRHRGQQLRPHLAGTQVADAAILRPLLGDEVRDLCQRLRRGKTDAGRDADPALNALAQLTRQGL